jgi:glutamyl-tRNA synthetase
VTAVATRFAPSPTGRLHVGNLRTALLNWLFARQQGGRFWLRLDDTDAARSTEAFADGIREDLAWAGLAPDGEVRQSQRGHLYQAALDRLVAAGRAYPAWDTPEELETARRIARAAHRPPVYDRAALALSDDDKARLTGERGPPHWRFRLETDGTVEWDDLIRGPSRIEPASLSDPVVRRADGAWLYMLPSVVDDIDMGITHVIRGEDHVPNSAIQLQMFAALAAEPPALAHAALLTSATGELSKRLGSEGADQLKDAGIEPAALLSYLARLGTSSPVEPFADAAPLVAGFAFAKLGRAPARYDPDELARLNARLLHDTPFAAVAQRLPASFTDAQWNAVRANALSVADAAGWVDVFANAPLPAPPALDSADAAACAAALSALPPEPWDASSWKAWTSAVASSTGRQGRALFQPLRLALTGRERGPDMAALLPLIPVSAARARLAIAASPAP